MNERSITSELRRLDRQDRHITQRLEGKIDSYGARTEYQVSSLKESVKAGLSSQKAETERGFSQVQIQFAEMRGDMKAVRAEVSGLKDSIESLKHFMMWGMAVIGLLATVMPYIISVIVPHTGG